MPRKLLWSKHQIHWGIEGCNKASSLNVTYIIISPLFQVCSSLDSLLFFDNTPSIWIKKTGREPTTETSYRVYKRKAGSPPEMWTEYIQNTSLERGLPIHKTTRFIMKVLHLAVARGQWRQTHKLHNAIMPTLEFVETVMLRQWAAHHFTCYAAVMVKDELRAETCTL